MQKGGFAVSVLSSLAIPNPAHLFNRPGNKKADNAYKAEIGENNKEEGT